MTLKKAAIYSIILFLTGCDTLSSVSSKKVNLKKTSYSSLPSWKTDNATNALYAFSLSCKQVKAGKYVNGADIYVSTKELKEICDDLPKDIAKVDQGQARKFFEQHFDAYLVSNSEGNSKGTFTGYYQPYLQGSKTKTAKFDTPIYGKPSDLTSGSKYNTRKEIEAGCVTGKAPILYYTEHEELFHLQVQGSGILVLPDGKKTSLNYAANNGHPFKGAGTILMEKGIRPADGYTAESVKTWCKENKELSRKYLKENDRYIFFQEAPESHPLGAQGVPLTPQRSLAIDTELIPLGLPIFLTTTVSGAPYNKLLVTQDAGVKIKGAVRGDIYFGTGDKALKVAGIQKSQGSYYILLPKGTRY